MSQDIEKVVLGSLVFFPNYLETVDITSEDFTVDRNKRAFDIICQIWEDTRPAEIDLNILASRLGGNDPASFAGSLTEGLPHLTADKFLDYVFELRKKDLERTLASEMQRELKIYQKTDSLSTDKVKLYIDLLDDLSQPLGNMGAVRLAQIEAKLISWLWPKRIPFGMLTLLCGDPGFGKSFLSIHLAALLSRGLPLPDSGGIAKKCSALFILGEDPIREAVRPRADANNADPQQIFVLKEDGFNLSQVKKIRSVTEQHKDIGLIVIDPLTAFFPPRTKFFEDPSVRTMLIPLVMLAEKLEIAVLAIAHFRKAEAESAIYRVAGSIGFAGIARSILAVSKDGNDPERRFLLSIKASYSQKPDALAFRIGNDLRITFEDAPIKADADEVLASREEKDAAAERSYVEGWLRDTLQDGPREYSEILTEAKKAGITRSTLYRIKDRLKVNTKQQGQGRYKTSTWALN